MQPTTPAPYPEQNATVAPGGVAMPPKKPVYKEVWFWVVIVGVAGIALLSLFVFGTTFMMVHSATSSIERGVSESFGEGSGPSFNTDGNPSGPCNGNCDCGGRGYNYNDSGNSSNSYNAVPDNGSGTDSGNGSSQADPFSQFPEELQDDLRQFHQNLDGFQDLQQYK